MANFDKSKIDEITSYLNKTMSSEQQRKFEEEIASNEALANEIRAQEFNRAYEFISIKADVKQMIDKLKRKGKDEEEDDSEIKRTPMRISFIRNPFVRALAASVLIALIGIGIWQLIDDKRGPIGEHKYTDSTKTSPLISEKIDEIARLSKQAREQAVPQELEKAILAYERAEDSISIKATAKLFEKPRVDTSKPNDSTLFGANPNSKPSKPDPQTESYRALYQGLIFLHTAEYTKAIDKFSQVEGSLADEALLYKALAYLKKNDTQKGRELLNEIIKNSTSPTFRIEAQALLDLLDEKK